VLCLKDLLSAIAKFRRFSLTRFELVRIFSESKEEELPSSLGKRNTVPVATDGPVAGMSDVPSKVSVGHLCLEVSDVQARKAYSLSGRVNAWDSNWEHYGLEVLHVSGLQSFLYGES
jgi:hypothetical protein